MKPLDRPPLSPVLSERARGAPRSSEGARTAERTQRSEATPQDAVVPAVTGAIDSRPSTDFSKAVSRELAARGLWPQWRAKNALWTPAFFTNPAKHTDDYRYLVTVLHPDAGGRHVDPFASPDAIGDYPLLSASVISNEKRSVFREGIALILDAPPECVVATCISDMHSGNYVNGAWSAAPDASKGAAVLFQHAGVRTPARFLADTYADAYNEVLLMGRFGTRSQVRTIGVAAITYGGPNDAHVTAEARKVAASLGVPLVELQATRNNPSSEAHLKEFVPPPEQQDDPSLWGNLFD